ncbi:ash family protein [Serratia quinivorans]|uniref:ash family protein n=1 Tax=Serratia quinivorans TaxID=137545 RepID=UPI0021BD9DA5|nr:ash family protein [Serratia quinivorans]
MNHFRTLCTHKNRLPCKITGRYSSAAAAKSAAGCGSPELLTAHNRAYAVFLCAMRCYTQFMVGRAGQPQGWPGSVGTGTSTPVRLTTHKCGSFGGELTKLPTEVATMATTPTKTHQKKPQAQLSVDCYRKLHRSNQLSHFVFIDLKSGNPSPLLKFYSPYLFSYINDDLNDISEELNAAGLFDHLLQQVGGEQ